MVRQERGLTSYWTSLRTAKDTPFNIQHHCVRMERDVCSGKTKQKIYKKNNKKRFCACLCVCMPFSGYKIFPWLWHSPLLPWLLENSTYTTHSFCDHPAQYVGSDLCFSSPSSKILIAQKSTWCTWPAILGNHHMASKQMSERQNVQANALSWSISANTSDA